jgi:hypothetical protein
MQDVPHTCRPSAFRPLCQYGTVPRSAPLVATRTRPRQRFRSSEGTCPHLVCRLEGIQCGTCRFDGVDLAGKQGECGHSRPRARALARRSQSALVGTRPEAGTTCSGGRIAATAVGAGQGVTSAGRRASAEVHSLPPCGRQRDVGSGGCPELHNWARPTPALKGRFLAGGDGTPAERAPPAPGMEGSIGRYRGHPAPRQEGLRNPWAPSRRPYLP